jgi:hypothetical protein
VEHYVTLFDSLFLPQGLALHASMQRHAGTHTLWVLCMDESAHEVLTRLALPNVRLIALAEAETDALRRVKPTRTRGEYCWTITPFTPGFVFEREPDAGRVTYLDADVWFRQDAGPVFDEFERSGKAVLITEHAYPPEFDQSKASGRFCVQFVTFVRGRGEPVRQWWAERCIEWCYSRTEDGKFGDQMYLDDWPERFGEWVHVLATPQWTQGPWNTTRFPAADARTFHFHGLRLMRDGVVLLTETYPVFEATQALLYRPYLEDLSRARATLNAIGQPPAPQLNKPLWLQRMRGAAKWAYLVCRGIWTRPTVKFGHLSRLGPTSRGER